jgi:hypothetical protein
MRKITLIMAAALTLAVLTRLPALPLDADGRTPAGPVAAAVSINPLELMRRATELPVQAVEDFSMIF